MKRFYFLAVLFGSLAAFGQPKDDGYAIKVTFKPFKNQFIYLGYYYGTQYPIVDSIKLNDKSEGVFKSDKKLGGGIYLIGYPDRSHFFEFLVDKEQHFSIVADSTDIVKGLKFENSNDNTVFNNYQQYMLSKGKEIDAAKNKLAGASHDDSVKLNAAIDKGNKEIRQYRDELMKKNPKSFLTTLLAGMQEPEIPSADKQPGGKYDSLYAYRYFKDHYWDGVNFYDERMARTTFFDGKLDKYFNQLVYPDADSVNKEIDWMLGYASANAEMKKFLLLKFVNRYLNQKYMWEDKVYVHLFEKYFSQKEYPWLDEKGKKIIFDRYYSMAANIFGSTAADIQLPDSTGKTKTLFSITNPYTIVIFWDPTCGHCKETLPRIDSIYRAKWSSLNVKIYAVAKETDGTKKDWLSFVGQHQLNGWDHVYNSKDANETRVKNNIPSYYQLYDVQVVPTLYLLDKDKSIIAKKIPFDQIDKVLDYKIKGQ